MAGESKPRVLIVDDEAVIVRLLQVNFRLEGFEVETSLRGDEVLDKVRSFRPDVVILDVMMPGVDGWEVCRRLKGDDDVRDVPIVLLSARAQDEDRDRGYALGVAAYVTKPFDPARLVALARRTLSGAEPD